ncbi:MULTISPECIES: hypothetical protein [unclassified Yoonia]|uniref:hypothetical protein n=1 Tax=unclassified Yoonia TaxID=2629118 RepID=UPI002AFFEFDE|nr:MULTISPECIES: hypothetical protein [unclassified Yoonia]
MSQPDTSPAAVQATTPDALALDRLTLIGLFSTTEGPAALLRAADGQVARIVPGMQTMGLTVTAIGDTQVLITDSAGVTFAMQLPPRD